MKNAHLLVFAAMGMSALLCGVSQTFAQGTPSQQAQVVLSKLSPPIYPPLARVARVLGDVEIAIQIRPDGSVASAEVVSGHPLLKAAALESAQQSSFECHECIASLTKYSVVYTFGYTTTEHCCEPQAVQDKGADRSAVTQSQNHVTILTEPWCTCDPRADIIKVRSAKCLYLWHCSRRYGL